MQARHFCQGCLIIVSTLTLPGGGNLLRAEEPFPPCDPSTVGLSAEAVELFGNHVGQLVERQEMVGAEIHVIKDRKTVLHLTFGWADREKEKRLSKHSLYCVRSMTKPLAGSAIQMLLQEKKISLDQPVADWIPAFDSPTHRNITIRHLLQHRSGLPLTIFDGPLSDYQSILQVADKAAQAELGFAPGTSFQYSDAGTDTLGAIIEKASGQTLEAFIQERILDPLDMENAYTLLEDAPDRDRVPSAYSGGVGQWQKHWSATDPPILPLFLTSQGLYCTTTDYARFLTLWMDGGRTGAKQLLAPESIERAFAPGSRFGNYPVGFRDLRATYGQQWLLYHNKDANTPSVFGHNGSDGTYAWAWPQEDMIVLLFSQTRGATAGMDLEGVIQQLLIDQDIDGHNQEQLAKQRAEAELSRFVGIYWDEDVETDYYVVSLENNQLYFERPGRFRAAGKTQAKEGLFHVGSTLKYQFELDQDPPATVLMTTSTRTERQTRYEPDENMPPIEDVASQVRAAYGIDKLDELGLLEIKGKMKSGPLGFGSSFTQWLDSRRSEFRVESWTSKAAVLTDGNEAAATGANGRLGMLDGAARLQELAGHPSIQYGGWLDFYDKVYVMREVERGSQTLYVLRAEAAGIPGKTILVDAESGLIVEEHSLQYIPGAGFLGAQTSFRDFRETEGLTLPFHVETKLSSPLIGTVVIDIDTVEIAASHEGRFEMPD